MKAIYPGSFDPITLGHIDIIQRLVPMFDEVVVLVAHSSRKDSLFTHVERMNLITRSLSSLEGRIKVDSFDGLTTDYMKKNDIKVIVRGLRAISDYEYEMIMAQMNKKLYPECETLFLPAAAHLNFISSRGVKEIAMNNGPLHDLIPQEIQSELIQKIRERKNP